MNFDASFFVALAFVLVLAGFWKLNLHGRVAAMLDERSDEIKKQLDDARALRQEALSVLSDYEKRAKEAEQEAAVLVEQAQEDAKRIAAEAELALKARLERRTKQAEDKIARAEAQLSQEVKQATVELAIEASAQLIGEKMTTAQSDRLVKNTIDSLAKNLH
ncbi:MAG: F0F1 ATP synthase subunit B [Parvibaculales bacterium]